MEYNSNKIENKNIGYQQVAILLNVLITYTKIDI